jgi:predicted dehydrogenase
MGKRRVRNLVRLGIPSIVGFDPRADRREEAAVQSPQLRTVATLEEGFSLGCDAAVISTPPDLHVGLAREAVRRGVSVFTEASVLDDDYAILDKEARAAGVVAAPSCTMRFLPPVRRMKQLTEDGRIGKILAYTDHSGQYLPDWHPWEDYRQFYAGQRRTGACREIVPFELSWITWVVGPVKKVSALRAKVSDLEVDIDDVYQLLLEHEGGALGHLLVEVLARSPIRRCAFIGSEGTLDWEWAERTVTLSSAGSRVPETYRESEGTVQPGYVHAEEPYVDEMAAYLAAVRGEQPWPYSISEDLEMLAVLRAAEQSSDEGRHISRPMA